MWADVCRNMCTSFESFSLMLIGERAEYVQKCTLCGRNTVFGPCLCGEAPGVDQHLLAHHQLKPLSALRVDQHLLADQQLSELTNNSHLTSR